MARAKKIGIYGGTFDPIHFGHLNLALELKEKRGLDEVWFVPAQLNPHKTHAPPLSSEHRFAMLKLALAPFPYFCIKDVESQRPPPSYTIETLRHFIEEAALNNLNYQFYLLMGEDALNSLHRWHLSEEIIRLVPLLIGLRSRGWEPQKAYSAAMQEAIEKGLTQTRLMDISGTDLRDRFSKGLYCGHLLPLSVIDYINKNHLYALK